MCKYRKIAISLFEKFLFNTPWHDILSIKIPYLIMTKSLIHVLESYFSPAFVCQTMQSSGLAERPIKKRCGSGSRVGLLPVKKVADQTLIPQVYMSKYPLARYRTPSWPWCICVSVCGKVRVWLCIDKGLYECMWMRLSVRVLWMFECCVESCI